MHVLGLFVGALVDSVEAHCNDKVVLLGRMVDETGGLREERSHRTYMQEISNCVTHPESTIPSHRMVRIGVACSVVPSGKAHLDK